MILKVLLLFFGCLSLGISKQLHNRTTFETVHEWKYVDFQYDSLARKEKIVNESRYDKSNIIILDFVLAKDDQTFVILNKNDKSPVSLTSVSELVAPNGPLLKPYPDWQWHVRKDCIGIFKASHVQVDSCNNLWVLDNGQLESGELVCPPQLLVFDLSSNTLKRRIPIPPKFATGKDGKGELGLLIVQTKGWFCGKATVYMTYFFTSGLLVWNGLDFWRIDGPDPKDLSGYLRIGSQYVKVKNGLYGFALSPKIDEKPQYLALSSLGSRHVFSAKIDDILATAPRIRVFNWSRLKFFDIFNLFGKSKPEKSDNDATIEYQRHRYVLITTSAALAFDSNGVLYTGLTNNTSVGCFKATEGIEYKNFDIIDEDPDKLQFIGGAQTYGSSVTGRSEEELWILTNRYLNFVHNSMNYSDINFRIMKQSTVTLLTNTKCK